MSTHLRADAWTLGEALRVARRGRWYAGVSARLVALGVVLPRRSRAARLGFYVLQHVDDLADGDLVPRDGDDPLDRIDAIIDAWTRAPDAPDVGGGLHAAMDVLRDELHRAAAGHGEESVESVTRLMRTMRHDHERRITRAVWSADEVVAQLHGTFADSIALLLVAAGARGETSIADVDALVDAMGWCSVVRDIREDLDVGICNIPGEVLDAGDLRAAFSQRRTDEVLAAPAVRAWWAQEHARIAPVVARARAQVDELRTRDKAAVRGVGGFVSAVERWHERAREGVPAS